jgi:hypothetical protein
MPSCYLLLSAASYAIGLVLSVLGTVMLFIGSLASFAGAFFPKVLRRLVLLLIMPSTCTSPLRPRDYCFPHWHGFLDRCMSFHCSHLRVALSYGINTNDTVHQADEAGKCWPPQFI